MMILTTTITVFADPLYVGFRTYQPDNETVAEVMQLMEENNIDTSKLLEWPVDNCPLGDFKNSDTGTSTETVNGK
jgi:hypothetical protein